ncbi:hypothetical protein X777_15841 [Ooceraea biroi]|uniref:Uncharacterized protein n=1 Tax=Ooceraea biroi TaxID=2015173 RepID=A0A026WVS0_OOCBI|nr:hypothetical protein X777_15841 [Ooceraea biroi]
MPATRYVSKQLADWSVLDQRDADPSRGSVKYEVIVVDTLHWEPRESTFARSDKDAPFARFTKRDPHVETQAAREAHRRGFHGDCFFGVVCQPGCSARNHSAVERANSPRNQNADHLCMSLGNTIVFYMQGKCGDNSNVTVIRDDVSLQRSVLLIFSLSV